VHRMSHAMDVPARRSGEKWPRRGPYRCDPCASTSLLSPSLLADLTLSLSPSARGRLYPIQHAINREAMGERVVLSMACRMVAQFTKRSLVIGSRTWRARDRSRDPSKLDLGGRCASRERCASCSTRGGGCRDRRRGDTDALRCTRRATGRIFRRWPTEGHAVIFGTRVGEGGFGG
jgi:hypothetical protein